MNTVDDDFISIINSQIMHIMVQSVKWWWWFGQYIYKMKQVEGHKQKNGVTKNGPYNNLLALEP